jgi:L-alanine-DL-glutamate epimerase-like enolase superfamily enzyme
MRITRIDTVYWEIGLGETYPRNPTEAALVHTDVARRLLGKNPRDIERTWADLFRAFDYQISGGTDTVAAPDLPGFGMRVKPEIWDHPKAIVRTSRR